MPQDRSSAPFGGMGAMSFAERLARCSRVNRRIEEAFVREFGVKWRGDLEIERAILVWSVSTLEGLAAWREAERAED